MGLFEYTNSEAFIKFNFVSFPALGIVVQELLSLEGVLASPQPDSP
jgi:hypothetical protein